MQLVRTDAERGPNRIRVLYVRPPASIISSNKAKSVVFFELFNHIRGESHWAFRADAFGRIFQLANQHGGLPKQLTIIVSLPKRSRADARVQAVRPINIKNGGAYNIQESILSFVMDSEVTEETIKAEVNAIIGLMLGKELKTIYYEQRKHSSSERMVKECEPDTGSMWKALDSARTEFTIERFDHVDDIITTDAALHLIGNMFKEVTDNPATWRTSAAAAFASSAFDLGFHH